MSYKASTLIEVVVALVITSILGAMGSMLFNNMWSAGQSGLGLKAETAVKASLLTISPMNSDADLEIELLREPYNNTDDLEIITCMALNNNGEIIYSEQKIQRIK